MHNEQWVVQRKQQAVHDRQCAVGGKRHAWAGVRGQDVQAVALSKWRFVTDRGD